MRGARFFSIATFVALLLYGAVGYFFLPWAAYDGDLTRMAMLPERQFGWTSELPRVEERWMQQASLQDADVLVIGDSFSTGRVWQTVLTREGMRVRTEHWDNMHGVCADLSKWLRAKGFRGRYVVLQIVERNLERDVRKSLACAQTHHSLRLDVDAPQPVPAQHLDRSRVDRSGRMSVGIRTVWHGLWLDHLAQAPDFEEWAVTSDVRVRRVPNGCVLFSHRQCMEALFFAEDRSEDLPESIIDDMAQLSGRLPQVSVTWVVVPNKTTAYFHPDKRFWDAAYARLQAPHLLHMVGEAIHRPTQDLYLGNNTHFSTQGYLLMGRAILEAMRRQP